MSVRLSVDIGGTFTDVVLAQDARLTTVKVLTTYDDPALGVLQGVDDVLSRTGVDADQISLVLHGTTLATNALIERRGASTALLTTAGHRDVLEMAFENRFEQYDVDIDRPAPLVPRHWRLGLSERLAADGQVLVDLDEDAVNLAVDRLVAEGVSAVAIGFLHSYANPVHEQRAAALIASRYPELSISLSSSVCPEIREYERLSTTVANAYVKPLMSQYLASLQVQLKARGILGQVLMMTSGGGLTTLSAAAEFPIRLVESGPAGGAMLAADLARTHGLERVLSFDMGGTTAKICLIDDGEPLHSRAFEVDRSYRFKKGSGLPVRIPVIEMVEIGAGGGSIASVDPLRRVLVGPASAGSEPGPACYDRGGMQATVTDADVVLGKLLPENFAGGKLKLSLSAARSVIEQDVCKPLSLEVAAGAHAVAEIVEENMASAARAHAAEWGKNVQGCTLVAFGGAAPLHAAQLAQKLKIKRMLVPAGAGVGSAVGFLLSPIRFEVVRSQYMRLDGLKIDLLSQLFGEMRVEAAEIIAGAGAVEGSLERREAFMRYVGQGYEISVDITGMVALEETVLRQRFEAAYQALYGRTIPGMEIEILSWTLALQAPKPSVDFTMQSVSEQNQTDLGESVMYLDGRTIDVPVSARGALCIGENYSGPMLVVEEQTTTVIPPDTSVTVLSDGTLSILFESS